MSSLLDLFIAKNAKRATKQQRRSSRLSRSEIQQRCCSWILVQLLNGREPTISEIAAACLADDG
jgi:hypothetical protein